MDCASRRRRSASFESNAEPGRAAPILAGWQTVDLDVESNGSDANLDVELYSGKWRVGRNTASGNEHLDRRRRRHLVARWKKHHLRLLGLSRREGRRGQQAARRRA